MGSTLRKNLVTKILESPFYSVIFDTTSDVSKVDQLSMIIRYIHIDQENNIVTVNETSLGFIVVSNSSALGLTMLAVKYLESVGLPLDRVRGQGYDGASVMSGRLGGVQISLADLVRENVDMQFPYHLCIVPATI